VRAPSQRRPDFPAHRREIYKYSFWSARLVAVDAALTDEQVDALRAVFMLVWRDAAARLGDAPPHPVDVAIHPSEIDGDQALAVIGAGRETSTEWDGTFADAAHIVIDVAVNWADDGVW
jgi:hypothetical protein